MTEPWKETVDVWVMVTSGVLGIEILLTTMVLTSS